MKIKFERMISILAVIIILVFKAASGANNLPIERQLQQQIKFPEALKETAENAIVCVAFTVDAHGKVDVINTNASHPSAKNAVVEQLQLITLESNDLEAEKVYFVKFNFKLIN